ncbi:hypothetical protein ES702_01017 [subsurface metagenome]
MRVEKNFKEFIALLNRNNVRYLIIGGFAYSFYAEPRFTKDIDIFIELSKENAEKIIKTIKDFGFIDVGLTEKDFLKTDQIIQLGVAPLRIDIATSIKGIVEFQNAWKNRVIGRYGDTKVYFISKEDLIKNKQALGRKQDLADIENLERI